MALQTIPVQQKIACVYVTGVSHDKSTKRPCQTYKVSATRDLTANAQADMVVSAVATEKLDGTCCLVEGFKDEPWLWARHDRKPSKVGERKFNQFKKTRSKSHDKAEAGSDEVFKWNPDSDFKEVPENWKPASRLDIKDGIVMPDSIGHTPGWIPVPLTSRQHCWHLSAVDLQEGVAIVLREADDFPGELVIETQTLSSLCGRTCELIGTNINGNPYGLGTKRCPLHLLVPHGSFVVNCPKPSDYDAMYDWFNDGTPDSLVEGIVWHCTNGELHKLHRHHLNLKWPVQEPHLAQRRIKVNIDTAGIAEGSQDDSRKDHYSQLSMLTRVNGQKFNSFKSLCQALETGAFISDS